MKILIIGGTRFLGRHVVDAALQKRHEVTLFNRGKSNPGLFPQVEQLRGDRAGDMQILANRKWDAVIDTCGYVPRVVRKSAELLAGNVGIYVFISTLSVYADFSAEGLNESSPIGKLEDETTEEITGETYGPLKVLCENEVQKAFPDKALIIRPGLIVGPYDPTDRFTYWPHRIDRGGQVLAPEPKDLSIMYIDARDLSEWIIKLIKKGRTGVFNADGPEEVLSMESFLNQCQQYTSSDARLTWVDAQFLLAQKVQPWTDLPMWLPGTGMAGMGSFDVSKALKAGLKFRSLKETVADTLYWVKRTRSEEPMRAGISLERETQLLAAWHTR
jgi:2'-hydroxyisoflavone reductase